MDGIRLNRCEAAPLRYVHDVLTGEFVTLGIVLLSPEHAFLGCSLTPNFTRVTTVFRNADATHLRRVCAGITEACEEWQRRAAEELPLDQFPRTLATVLPKLVPPEDAALQFSLVHISGVTADPQRTLDELFERYVGKETERRERPGRTEDQMWREFARALPNPELVRQLHPYTLKSEHVVWEFRHAYRNATWHAVQPVSLDMADTEHIINKALVWTARLEELRPRDRDTEVKMLIGLPSPNRSRPIRDAAKNGSAILLERAQKHAKVIYESDRQRLAAEVADDLVHAA